MSIRKASTSTATRKNIQVTSGTTTTAITSFNADVLLVAGGGGAERSGGGGAGGYVELFNEKFFTNVTYTITVGAGGAGGNITGQVDPTKGLNSSITHSQNSLYVAFGGGTGFYTVGTAPLITSADYTPLWNGGSGGGAGVNTTNISYEVGHPYGFLNNQGYRGGTTNGSGGDYGGGGGAGSNGVGGNPGQSMAGGSGVLSSILPYYFSGGGGGVSSTTARPNGGAGGGGGGTSQYSVTGYQGLGDTNGINPGGNGTYVSAGIGNGGSGGTNTGGGGGSASGTTGRPGGSGGSGIVAIRISNANVALLSSVSTTGSPTLTTPTGYNVYQFNGSGSITFNS